MEKDGGDHGPRNGVTVAEQLGSELETSALSEEQGTEPMAVEEDTVPSIQSAPQSSDGGPPAELLPELDDEDLVSAVEALIFVSGEPLGIERLAEVTRCSRDRLGEAVATLKHRYSQNNRGVEFAEIAGGYQFRSSAVFAPFIRALRAGKPRKLSAAALETLAIVSYRQPIVRSDIERIRGVDVSPTLKTLLERNLVRIVGHQPTAGNPALYGTTEQFLKLFGMASLAELPTLRDLKEIESDPGEIDEPGDEGKLNPIVSHDSSLTAAPDVHLNADETRPRDEQNP